jgi:hypothetical protein
MDFSWNNDTMECSGSFPTQEDLLEHLRSAPSVLPDTKLVSLSTKTWTKDTHRLFDTEATDQHMEQRFVVPVNRGQQPYKFSMDAEGHVHVHAEKSQKSRGMHGLHMQLKMLQSTDELVVEETPRHAQATKNQPEKSRVWLKVDSVGHELKEGDVLKIGRYNLTVQQVYLDGPPRVPSYSAAGVDDVQLQELQRSNAEEVVCRICLGGPEEEDDPLLVAPCLCKGSSTALHLGCLRQWLEVKYLVKNLDNSYISFKPPGCEVCKAAYPSSLQRGEGQVPLFSGVPAVAPPFVVISIPKGAGDAQDRPHGERFIYAPTSSHPLLRIGRSHEAELEVKDVTVSRIHASVAFQDGSFILRDNNSKFQTLVLPRQATVLSARQEPLDYQIGRAVLSFSLINQ